MPDGPRYDDDFFAWAQYQAEVLRTLDTRDNRFDRGNVAEELEDLGKNYRDAVRSQIRRILVHLLKLAYSPARDPRADWLDTVIEAQAVLDDKMTPSLERDVAQTLPKLYAVARRRVMIELEKYGERGAVLSLPAECPFALEEILAENWLPATAEQQARETE